MCVNIISRSFSWHEDGMGPDLGVEKDGPPPSPFPSFFLQPLPQHPYHVQRGSGAIEQGKYVPTCKGREQETGEGARAPPPQPLTHVQGVN